MSHTSGVSSSLFYYLHDSGLSFSATNSRSQDITPTRRPTTLTDILRRTLNVLPHVLDPRSQYVGNGPDDGRGGVGVQAWARMLAFPYRPYRR
jgi:hypothetical protein